MSLELWAFEAAAARVRHLHQERAALLQHLLVAEDELIRDAAAAHRAGTVDARGLLDAYNLVREGGSPDSSRAGDGASPMIATHS